MNQQCFRQLISGQSSGLGVVLLRFSLAVASCFYSAVIGLRNSLYSKGWLKTHRVSAVVISIGNITVGGTGKTPLVIWLCKFLRQKEVRCAVLTRGYKTTKNLKLKTQNYSDEPAILAKSCPEAKVVVNPDRVAAATEAVNKFGAEILIMDDGFQHRRLARDADIATIDAMCPFGYGKMLPAGLLREPVTALKRADAVVITRCDQVAEAQLNQLEKKLQQVNTNMIIARSIHSPICAKSIGNKEISLEQLKDKKIFAFCGIGNPNAFLGTIKGLGVNLVGSKIYNDHHRYKNNDVTDIYEEARYLNADLILTTQKDCTKIASPTSAKEDIPLAYLEIELKFIIGEDKLKRLIKDTMACKIMSRES